MRLLLWVRTALTSCMGVFFLFIFFYLPYFSCISEDCFNMILDLRTNIFSLAASTISDECLTNSEAVMAPFTGFNLVYLHHL